MSFSSSRRGDISYALPEEFDDYDRAAAFYLFTRPLEGSILSEAGTIDLHHWVLVAVFNDESIRSMEANESGGKLLPSFMKESPKEEGKLWELVPVITSPKKLRDVTNKNRLNSSNYSAKNNNCQCWVKETARMINSNLASAVKSYRSNAEVPMTETAFKCSFASSRASSRSAGRILISSMKSQLSSNRSIQHHHSE